MGKNNEQIARIRKMNSFIEKQTGQHAVRPFRADSYVNLLNKWGTSRDSSESYQFVGEPDIPDTTLTEFYEGNGLFAKIIDAPAEEAIKNGFTLKDVTDEDTINFYTEALDELDWEEVFGQGMKLQRLFGGAIAVMLINDGGGIEDPLDWENIKSIDDIVLFDRSVIDVDYSSLYQYDRNDPFSSRGSRLGSPEFYKVNSKYGNFTVHESRVLEFKNGKLPENSSHTNYQLWGLPEYLRINKAIRDAEISHGTAAKLLDRSIQSVYKMQGLSQLLSTTEGEDMVLRRMQVIDMARGLLNTMVIDADGEDYNFQTFTMTGVKDVIETTHSFVSAITNVPSMILFGTGPNGMSSTDESSMENWYSFVRRLQKRSMRSNLRYLLSVLFQAGLYTGEVKEIPKIKIEFNPLKVVTETEQLDIDQKRAQVELTRAQTTQAYIDMQVLDPQEARNKLAESEEYDVETILDDYDEEELEENAPYNQAQPAMPGMEGIGGAAPGQPVPTQAPQGTASGQTAPEQAEGIEGSAAPNAPAATKLPQDMTDKDVEDIKKEKEEDKLAEDEEEIPDDHDQSKLSGVGVIVVKDGKILCGTRYNDTGYGLLCGPGGHIEKNETSEQAAIREAQEEFSITPKALYSLGFGPVEPETNTYPEIFLCTEWRGVPVCDEVEMIDPQFLSLEELEEYRYQLFAPFRAGVDLMLKKLYSAATEPTEKVVENDDLGEKSIDFSSVCDNVSLRDFILQFAEGRQDMGVKGMKWGHHKISDQDRKKIESRIVGHVSSSGVAVKRISTHAFERIGERKISAGQVEALLDSKNVTPSTKNPNCDVYDIPGKRLVMDKQGNIVSIMWRKQNK